MKKRLMAAMVLTVLLIAALPAGFIVFATEYGTEKLNETFQTFEGDEGATDVFEDDWNGWTIATDGTGTLDSEFSIITESYTKQPTKNKAAKLHRTDVSTSNSQKYLLKNLLTLRNRMK